MARIRRCPGPPLESGAIYCGRATRRTDGYCNLHRPEAPPDPDPEEVPADERASR